MKTGRTLVQLAQELERQQAARKDFIAPQGALDAVLVGDEVRINGLKNEEPKSLTTLAHSQLATELEIPQKYYDRMKAQQPDLLAKNITTWLHATPEKKRMIRTLDGKVRAVLSPKFRPLDNFELVNAALPVLIENKVEIMSAEVTETRLYLKGYLPSLSDVLPDGLEYGQGHHIFRGDRGPMMSSITISNSEVGRGGLSVEPGVFTLGCTNLMVLKAAVMKKYHVGKAFSTDDNWEVFRDETRKADDTAFWLKVADVTKAAFDPAIFAEAMAQIKTAAARGITTDDLPKVVELVVEELNLSPKFSGGILKALAAGGDLTQYGLSAAITRVANTVEDYEEATVLEHSGGDVIEFSAEKWAKLTEQKAA